MRLIFSLLLFCGLAFVSLPQTKAVNMLWPVENHIAVPDFEKNDRALVFLNKYTQKIVKLKDALIYRFKKLDKSILKDPMILLWISALFLILGGGLIFIEVSIYSLALFTLMGMLFLLLGTIYLAMLFDRLFDGTVVLGAYTIPVLHGLDFLGISFLCFIIALVLLVLWLLSPGLLFLIWGAVSIYLSFIFFCNCMGRKMVNL
jgi:hypothetical protein